jgi:hypothetical protein
MTHLCIFNLPSSTIMGIPLRYLPAGWKVQGEGKIQAMECTEGDTDASSQAVVEILNSNLNSN